MRLRGSLVVFARIACRPPTLCGCSPDPSAVLLRGTVESESGAPLPGVRVRSEVGPPSAHNNDSVRAHLNYDIRQMRLHAPPTVMPTRT